MKHRLASPYYRLSTQVLRKPFLLLCITSLFSFPAVNYANTATAGVSIVNQQKEVKGIIYDETNTPVAGATIIVKNSTRGSITDIDGNSLSPLQLEMNCWSTSLDTKLQ